MKRWGVVLSSIFILSCGGNTPAPTPTAPNVPQTPTPPTPPAPTTFLIAGTVRDDKAAPVAGAEVFVGCLGCKTGPGFGATTNAAGGYSGNLPAGTWGMIVRKPGFTTVTIYDLVVTGNTTRDITLKPGVVLSGRTFEEGVGPLTGVRIEVLTGPSAGLSDTTNPPGVENAYSLTVLPGEARLRATKEGYDPVERVVNAVADTHNVDFTLKWAYGSCLRSVTPVFFNDYGSAGGEESVIVDVNAEKLWSVTADQPWLTITSPSTQRDAARVTFHILPHAPGAIEPRTGAIMIRCSASEGQNVWVTQNPDCQAELTPHADTPDVFPAAGGTGNLRIRTGTPQCRWKANSKVDWIRGTGVNSWRGDFDRVTFVVSENRTGVPRTGTFIVGEKAWIVRQQ